MDKDTNDKFDAIVNSSSHVMNTILDYFAKRNLHIGTVEESMQFIATEYGEACEELIARNQKFTRNHPENKPQEFDADRFTEELGDIIMMCMLAGVAVNRNPITFLLLKIERKLKGLSDGKKDTITSS